MLPLLLSAPQPPRQHLVAHTTGGANDHTASRWTYHSRRPVLCGGVRNAAQFPTVARRSLEHRASHHRLGVGDNGIAIFLNGRRVHAGTQPYASPDLGRVTADANVVELPLVRGATELVLAVTDRAFGWGFRARLDDDQRVALGVP